MAGAAVAGSSDPRRLPSTPGITPRQAFFIVALVLFIVLLALVLYLLLAVKPVRP